MKCPHCNYKHGYEWEEDDEGDTEMVEHQGYHGDFYRLSNGVKMERQRYSFEDEWTDTMQIRGCPKCNKLFMEG